MLWDREEGREGLLVPHVGNLIDRENKTVFQSGFGLDRPFLAPGILFAILTTEALGLFVLRLPGTLQFDNFAFSDIGSNLTVQYLLTRGYRPTVDFMYHYGLLPLWIGSIWFRVFGVEPIAWIAAVPLIDFLIVWGFVRLVTNLKINLAGTLLIALTASLTIPSSFINLTHGIEPIFLIHALASQAGGNRRQALSLATVSVFVKPSMAYFLGLILVVFIGINLRRNRVSALSGLMREIWPAAFVGCVLAAVLALRFGPAPLLHSVVPTQGLAMYRAQGFGFFSLQADRLLRRPRRPGPITAPTSPDLGSFTQPCLSPPRSLQCAICLVP